MTERPITNWLPLSLKDAEKKGWSDLDVILVTGDAYIDHPAFGAAVIGRVIENQGFRVGIISQPNWRDDWRDFKKLGKPRLFFGVTAGNMDSMVNHYTAAKRKRSDDAYTAGNKAGFRPDHAAVVYTNILKQLFLETPVVLGGIEASLRRLAHYDYWKDTLMPSILAQCDADLLIYGMGERPLIELLKLMDRGIPINQLRTIQQTALKVDLDNLPNGRKNWETIDLAPFEECAENKQKFVTAFRQMEQESALRHSKRLIQKTGDKLVAINPPFPTMSQKEVDRCYDLPYTRLPHPRYKKRGIIPAFEMIKYSVNLHRGCFGGCSFCAIGAHQGKFVSSRSKKSIMREIDEISGMTGFSGVLSDLGGPTANMYKMKGMDDNQCDSCIRPSCIFPKICDNLITDHAPLVELYREVRSLPGIKKAFIGSGIRYDLFVSRPDEAAKNSHEAYQEELIRYHVSGRLKVAPEHTSDRVLKQMRKPSFNLFRKFKKNFDRISREFDLNLTLVPYFISGHPGCELEDMARLASETKQLGYKLRQIQGFMPTPMTLSSVIYYAGFFPGPKKPVYSAKSKEEKAAQNKFFFWYKRENAGWIKDRLKEMGLPDLLK